MNPGARERRNGVRERGVRRRRRSEGRGGRGRPWMVPLAREREGNRRMPVPLGASRRAASRPLGASCVSFLGSRP